MKPRIAILKTVLETLQAQNHTSMSALFSGIDDWAQDSYTQQATLLEKVEFYFLLAKIELAKNDTEKKLEKATEYLTNANTFLTQARLDQNTESSLLDMAADLTEFLKNRTEPSLKSLFPTSLGNTLYFFENILLCSRKHLDQARNFYEVTKDSSNAEISRFKQQAAVVYCAYALLGDRDLPKNLPLADGCDITLHYLRHHTKYKRQDRDYPHELTRSLTALLKNDKEKPAYYDDINLIFKHLVSLDRFYWTSDRLQAQEVLKTFLVFKRRHQDKDIRPFIDEFLKFLDSTTSPPTISRNYFFTLMSFLSDYSALEPQGLSIDISSLITKTIKEVTDTATVAIQTRYQNLLNLLHSLLDFLSQPANRTLHESLLNVLNNTTESLKSISQPTPTTTGMKKYCNDVISWIKILAHENFNDLLNPEKIFASNPTFINQFSQLISAVLTAIMNQLNAISVDCTDVENTTPEPLSLPEKPTKHFAALWDSLNLIDPNLKSNLQQALLKPLQIIIDYHLNHGKKLPTLNEWYDKKRSTCLKEISCLFHAYRDISQKPIPFEMRSMLDPIFLGFWEIDNVSCAKTFKYFECAEDDISADIARVFAKRPHSNTNGSLNAFTDALGIDWLIVFLSHTPIGNEYFVLPYTDPRTMGGSAGSDEKQLHTNYLDELFKRFFKKAADVDAVSEKPLPRPAYAGVSLIFILRYLADNFHNSFIHKKDPKLLLQQWQQLMLSYARYHLRHSDKSKHQAMIDDIKSFPPLCNVCWNDNDKKANKLFQQFKDDMLLALDTKTSRPLRRRDETQKCFDILRLVYLEKTPEKTREILKELILGGVEEVIPEFNQVYKDSLELFLIPMQALMKNRQSKVLEETCKTNLLLVEGYIRTQLNIKWNSKSKMFDIEYFLLALLKHDSEGLKIFYNLDQNQFMSYINILNGFNFLKNYCQIDVTTLQQQTPQRQSFPLSFFINDDLAMSPPGKIIKPNFTASPNSKPSSTNNLQLIDIPSDTTSAQKPTPPQTPPLQQYRPGMP